MDAENLPIEKTHKEFKKVLNSFSLTMLGVGALIGGGIFSVLGAVTTISGPFSYLSYLLMGIVALITVYSYERLAIRWGFTCGGEFSYIQAAFNTINEPKKAVLGVYTGLLLFYGYIGSLSLYTYTFVVYFLNLVDLEITDSALIATTFLVVSIFMLINLGKVKEIAWLENLLVVIKIAILILFSFLGIYYAFHNEEFRPIFIHHLGLDGSISQYFNFNHILIGTSIIIVSFQGYQIIGNACEEMQDREKNIRAMHISLIISLVIYVLTSIVAVGILGSDGIIGDGVHDAEIAVANSARIFMGRTGSTLISFGVILSTSSALNATFLGTSRLGLEMAEYNYLPKKLGVISEKNGVPKNSVIFISVLTLIVAIISGGALAIAGLTDLIFAQVFLIINYTNLKARKETKSKILWPLLGTILTFLLFIVLLVYFIATIVEHRYAIIFFSITEVSILYLIVRKNRPSIKEAEIDLK